MVYWRFFCALLFLLAPTVSRAHDAFAADVKGLVDASFQRLQLEIKFASVTAEGFMDDLVGRDNQVSEANIDNVRQHLGAKAQHFFVIEQDGHKLNPEKVVIDVHNQEDAVFVRLFFSGLHPGPVTIENHFIAATNPEFVTTLTLFDSAGTQLGLFVQTLDKPNSETELALISEANQRGVFSGFLYQGVIHIVFGFDHLLFLAGLLIVCGSWRPAVMVITCFTLAHTLTLSLAVLDVIRLPSVLVEILIALSIVYVGVENLLTHEHPKHRWILTGVFGLVHGLGFANVLRDMGLGAEGAPVALPLLSFNLGVELGQVTLAALFLPLLWWLFRWPQAQLHIPWVASVVIAVAGVYWAVERSFALLS